MRFRQAAAWRVEVAWDGDRVLQAAGGAAPDYRYQGDGEAGGDADGAAAFAQAPELFGNGIPVGDREASARQFVVLLRPQFGRYQIERTDRRHSADTTSQTRPQ
ncbi:hypothetical protein X739_27085 [Mesorhizobium sp. LNHC220B00]|nr:hypothetical protein X739_27085 [Mesorhizobium sp. LNHC220B00]ESY97726.1 hypothetical protein X738_17610 [Mesorhizobium sp. LNHC209A00]